MNWRRGMFRLWCVIAGAWIIVAASFLPAEIRAVYAPVIFHDGEQGLSFPANTPSATVKKALIDYLKDRDTRNHPPPVGFTIDAQSEAKAADQIMGSYQPRGLAAVIIKGVAVALSVPIALVVIGLTFWWIGAGFRHTASR